MTQWSEGMTAPPQTIPLPVELSEGNCQGERLRPRLKQDLWFPPDSGDRPNANAQAARDEAWRLFCRTCPVLEACFEHALEYELYGTWAGTTEHDRLRLRREFASDSEPELLEYARNRLRAGYIPIPSITCVRKGCIRPVATEGTMCRPHKAAAKRDEGIQRHGSHCVMCGAEKPPTRLTCSSKCRSALAREQAAGRPAVRRKKT